MLLRIDWLSGLIGALLWSSGAAKWASESGPAGRFAWVGLRWCGGWRGANLRGFDDQAQIQAEGCHPPIFPKDLQARVAQAISALGVQTNRGTRYQACPHHCDA